MSEPTTTPKRQPISQQIADYMKPVPLLAAGILFIVIGVVIGIVGLLGHGAPTQVVATPNLATVRITAQGFQPASLVVPANTVVAWASDDNTTTHIVASGPYPQDSDTPGLKSTQLGAGAQFRYKFSQAGTYHYHDDLNPTLNGIVTVK